MLTNYRQITLRTLRQRKGYAAVSILGLTVGIACCLLIFLYARSEFDVNSIFSNVDDLYRIDSEWRDPTMGIPMTTLAPVGQTLVREFPEAVNQVRIYNMTNTVRIEDESYRRSVMMADTSIFRMFDPPMLHGDPVAALDQPRSVVVTQVFAETAFGTSDALGQTVNIETWSSGWQSYTVTGVIETIPYNSLTFFADEAYDLIIPPTPYGDYFDESGWNGWHSRYILQFVQLAPEASVESLQAKLDGFVETYAHADFHGNLTIRLNPLRTLYLTEFENRGWRVIWMLTVVGCLILLIACINFTNLATAQSFTRVNEIGVRKTLGAQRSQLVAQFLGESLMSSLAAAVLGLILAALALKPFLHLLGKEMVIETPWDGTTLVSLFGLALVTGILAGTYPALVLSSFRPASALKGLQRFRPSVLWLRRGLVMVQFAAAIVLLISVYTISRQLSFVTEKDLGFDQENVLVVQSVPRRWDDAGLGEAKTARARLLDAVPESRSVSLSWGTATEGGGNTRELLPEGRNRDESVSMAYHVVDGPFLETYGLELKSGRFFAADYADGADGAAGTPGVVINERAAEAFGWDPTEAIGQTLRLDFSTDTDDAPPAGLQVIGVVADIHFESLHEPIRPLAYFDVEAELMYRVMSIKFVSTDLAQTVETIEAAWAEVFPAAPFDYYFMDDDLDRVYRKEQEIRQLVSVAAALALFIACLGMLGLASLSVGQRTKEIGVRKVLGATVPAIVLLLSRDIVQLLLVALVVATPIAFLLMDRWLQSFAYHVDISWQTFVLAGLAAIALAWLTVSYHSIKAALADPVKSLRYE